jgi:hypothetical protein
LIQNAKNENLPGFPKACNSGKPGLILLPGRLFRQPASILPFQQERVQYVSELIQYARKLIQAFPLPL